MDASGWRVFAGVRREEDAEALRQVASERLITLPLEITDQAQISAAAEEIAELVGDAGLDGLVNNAGVTIPCPLEALPLDDLRRLLEVNLVGQLAVTQALLPQLRMSRGRVVFVSSISSRRAIPFLAAYSASKSGLGAIADGLRQELRSWQIGVSLIEPGAIETPIWDRGEKEFDSVLERSSADTNILYGGAIASFRKLTERARSHRISPQKVVAAIEHALVARRPRIRYLVGLDARSQAFALRFMPDRAVDFAVARFM
jgi:NAD(P)-dependent dehydrogenase (short-subunit alcohol dehydrogenase family)